MPHFNFTYELDNLDSLVEDLLRRKSQVDVDPSAAVADGNNSSKSSTTNNEGEDSCLATFKSNYAKLPDYLKYCFDYCCIFIRYSIEKGRLVWLLLAEGLIPEKPGGIMENIVENMITQLIGLGMLQQVLDSDGNELKVPSLYRQFSLIELEKQDFVANAANSPLLVVIVDDGKGINPKFKSLVIRSLFMITAKCCCYSFGSTKGFSWASMETVCGFQLLLVLDLDGEVEFLPNELGYLVHLRYLGIKNSNLNVLPQILGNLQKLQTLDIRMCGRLHQLPIEVLNIQQLRHLLMSKFINDGEIRVPKGIGTLTNLHTCTGVYAGEGIASELSALTQLKELGVKRVNEDHASELSVAIIKMENLICLSLEVELAYARNEMYSVFPNEFEPFSPPPPIQELYLRGCLVQLPIWLASMSNLTRLHLSFSHLPKDPNFSPSVSSQIKTSKSMGSLQSKAHW